MATVYQEKPKEYEETARKWTQMYAKEDKKTKDEELIESLSKEFDTNRVAEKAAMNIWNEKRLREELKH